MLGQLYTVYEQSHKYDKVDMVDEFCSNTFMSANANVFHILQLKNLSHVNHNWGKILEMRIARVTEIRNGVGVGKLITFL